MRSLKKIPSHYIKVLIRFFNDEITQEECLKHVHRALEEVAGLKKAVEHEL